MSRYVGISKFDDANANGYSLVIFYSSCPHKCFGCQNPETQSKDVGKLFTKEIQQKIFKHIKDNDYIYDALVLSGGDPLCDDNIKDVLEFAKEFKTLFPNKEIWTYTGFTLEQVQSNNQRKEILKYTDYIKCGRYKKELTAIDYIQYDIRIATSNQRIYKKGVDYN